jgi:hypothetical protein
MLAVISIFGLLMTRQILFVGPNLETLFFAVTIFLGYGVVNWILLAYTKLITSELQSKSSFIGKIQLTVRVIQYSIFGILVVALSNEIINGIYNENTRFFTASAYTISTIAATIILGLLSYKFFKWYSLTDRKNIVVLLYGLAAASLAVSIGGDGFGKLLLVNIIQEESPVGATPHSEFIYQYSEKYQGYLKYTVVNPEITSLYLVAPYFQDLYKFIAVYVSSYPPYIFTWLSSVALLYTFYQRVGSFPIKYWIILTIPLILYLIGSGLVFSLPSDAAYIYYFRIIFRAGTIGSSVLFGLIFYIITRNIDARKLKDYLTITAIGITTVGIVNETSALHATYGAAIHSLVLLSSFMFMLGLYSAALSISQDRSFRKTIRESIPVLFDNIGAAQIEQVLLGRVTKLLKTKKQKIEEETGGISHSLTEADVQEYVARVIQEREK